MFKYGYICVPNIHTETVLYWFSETCSEFLGVKVLYVPSQKEPLAEGKRALPEEGCEGIQGTLNNPGFKPLKFEGFRKEAGLNAFIPSPQRWTELTRANGSFF